MKTVIALLLSAAVIFSLAGGGTTGPRETLPTSGDVQIPNPWMELDTLEEAEEAAGFDIEVPDTIDGYGERCFRVMTADGGALLEVLCRNEAGSLRIRKAPGSGDISGDWNSYADSTDVTVNGSTVTLRGNDGQVSLAIWCAGGYAYAVTSDTALPADAMTALAEAVR